MHKLAALGFYLAVYKSFLEVQKGIWLLFSIIEIKWK